MELEAITVEEGDSGGLREKLVTSWFELDKELIVGSCQRGY